MLVTKSNFDLACKEIEGIKERAFDSETFTLFWFRMKAMVEAGLVPGCFAFQVAAGEKDYYFDFLHSPDKLGDREFLLFNERLTADPDVLWYIQNAKFDLHQAANHDVHFAGTVHCTQAIARVMNNTEESCKLEDLGQKYLKVGKVNLDEFWKQPGMVTKVRMPGRGENFFEQKHFDKLPLETSYTYGNQDTRLCYNLGRLQVSRITAEVEKMARDGVGSMFGFNALDVMRTERELTKVLYKMERRGVQLDLAYVQEALAFDYKKADEYQAQLDAIARRALAPDVAIDWQSPKQLKPLFDALKEPYGYTEKGNASFDKEALEGSKSELAQTILKYRFHAKRASTYWENFLWLADENGVLHADFQQGGPETGRMSCRSPNLQNLPKRRDKDQAEFRVRRAFVPRPGFVFADQDWDQMEYRMMVCYSKEMPLIERINNEGLDVHEAVNLEMEIGDREEAKTVNFQTLYGGGTAKLAQALYPVRLSLQALKDIYTLMRWKGWTEENIREGLGQEYEIGKGKWRRKYALNFSREDFDHDLPLLRKADQLRELYFSKLPNTADWIERVKAVAKDRGFIINWAGRIMRYDADTNYKAPNGLIQGGCGDVSKKGLLAADRIFQGTDSGLVAQVHDEFLSEVRESDAHLADAIVQAMETIFPSELLKLTAGAAWSRKSWGDLQDTLETA